MVKKISSIIAIVLFISICCLTIYKLNKKHEDKLYNVLYSEIKYAANKCFLENKCDKNLILKDLYDAKYLEIKYNPISKEELNKNIKITIDGNKVLVDGYDR